MFKEFTKAMDTVSRIETKKAADILVRTYKKGGNVYIIGNGGSSAIASHWANDLNKPTLNGYKGKRFKAICLSDNTPILTAIANDIGYEHIFSEQLKNFIRPPDTLIVISSSGNSPNIIKAVQLANKHKIKVIALVGFDGGRIKADAKIYVNSKEYGIIEPIHDAITHIITKHIYENI